MTADDPYSIIVQTKKELKPFASMIPTLCTLVRRLQPGDSVSTIETVLFANAYCVGPKNLRL